MADRIDTVDSRARLKPRKTAYWQRLSTGRHLGFRKLTATSTGTWFAQAYDSATREQIRHGLGDFSDYPAHQRFDLAKREAEAWFKHLDLGGSTETITVKTACENYVKSVRSKNGDTKADEVLARFKRWVYDEKLADIALPKLTRKHIDGWRNKLADTPVIIDPHAKSPRTRPRSSSTLNRDMTALRAALNLAHDDGDVTSDMAWRVALRPVTGAIRRRDIYLDRQQRRTLIAKASPDLAAFLRGLSVLPLRPGALAALSVENLDPRLAVLTIGKDKAGKDRKIPLPPKTAQFLAAQTNDRPHDAPLFARADGKRWTKDAWKGPIKEAAISAELPKETTAYTLRHSAITDLVPTLDLLTVAQISGTSVAMIERHYGHLRGDRAKTALAGLVL